MLAPASNANSERVFSSLRRVKTYLRYTMTQTRLENLMTLAIHKEILDKTKTDLIQAANTFVKPDSTFCKANIYDNFRYILLVATYEYSNIW